MRKRPRYGDIDSALNRDWISDRNKRLHSRCGVQLRSWWRIRNEEQGYNL